MRCFPLIVLGVTLAACGCSKKTAKVAGPSGDTPPPPAPEKGKPDDKVRPDDKTTPGGEKPNWLTDPRFAKKDKEGGPTLPIEPVSPTGKPGWGIPAPEGGWTPPNVTPPAANPMMPPQPPGVGLPPVGVPGVGVPPAIPPQPPVAGGAPPGPAAPLTPNGGPRNAVQRLVAMNDMREVWIFIENASGASGTMPGPDVIYAALVEAKSPAAALVKEGSITLTGTRTRESVWAFETAALAQGGLVVSQQGVKKLTAAELTQRLMGR